MDPRWYRYFFQKSIEQTPVVPFVPFPGSLSGLSIANGIDATNDIDIAVGTATDSTDTALITLGSVLTKQLDAAWAAGTNAGGLDTGSIANTTYHVFVISSDDGTLVDGLFSASLTPTMPTGYTLYRRVGSIVRVGGAIKLFTHSGNYFRLKTPTLDVNVSNLSTSSTSYALGTPLGISLQVLLNIETAHISANNYVYIHNPSDTSTAPSNNTAPLATIHAPVAGEAGSGQAIVWTDDSAQIAARSDNSGTFLRVAPLGWFDTL